MRRYAAIVVVLGVCLAAGCEKRRGGGGADVLGTKGAVVDATTECTTPNSDGVRCDKKTCKTDAVSDCNDFASRCLKYGHQYDGTRTQGTCTRIAQ